MDLLLVSSSLIGRKPCQHYGAIRVGTNLDLGREYMAYYNDADLNIDDDLDDDSIPTISIWESNM